MRCDLFANRTGDDVYCVAALLKISDPILTGRAAAVGILLQKYGLELWKPALWTDEAGKKMLALSSNYDRAATIRHHLAQHHWTAIFTTSYKNLLHAAQERNAPVPDYYAKGF